jgi:CRP-like cAMP-binding protein
MSQNFIAYFTEKAGLTKQELQLLEPYFNESFYKKGTVLLKQGEVCQHIFFIEKGLLRAYTLDDNGKEHIIQFATENWFISDRSSVFFNEESGFYIEAVEDSQVVMLHRDFTQKAAQLSVNFQQYNERLLQTHIHQLQSRINLLLGASAEDRYLNFINLYPDLLLRVPQWMIASYLGITPEGLSRVRKELARKNFNPSKN